MTNLAFKRNFKVKLVKRMRYSYTYWNREVIFKQSSSNVLEFEIPVLEFEITLSSRVMSLYRLLYVLQHILYSWASWNQSTQYKMCQQFSATTNKGYTVIAPTGSNCFRRSLHSRPCIFPVSNLDKKRKLCGWWQFFMRRWSFDWRTMKPTTDW